MEIKKLASFLEKFKILAVSRETIKKEIVETIFKKTGALIDADHIIIKNNTLIIEENPGVKSVIFMRKQQILGELREKLDTKAPADIR